MRLIAGVVFQDRHAAAVVRDAQFALDDVLGDHGLAHGLADFNLRLVLLKLTAAHEQVSALDLERVATFAITVPLNEGAIAETHRALAGDLRDLIARSPERRVDEANTPGVIGSHAHHRWIGTVERNKFAVGNQQANVRALLHLQRRDAVIRADAEEISVAVAGPRFDEFVADAVAEAERIEHIFPVALAEDERLAVFLLPLE